MLQRDSLCTASWCSAQRTAGGGAPIIQLSASKHQTRALGNWRAAAAAVAVLCSLVLCVGLVHHSQACWSGQPNWLAVARATGSRRAFLQQPCRSLLLHVQFITASSWPFPAATVPGPANPRTSPLHSRSSKRKSLLAAESPALPLSAAVQGLQQQRPLPRTLIIVNTCTSYMQTLGAAALASWVDLVPADVVFALGKPADAATAEAQDSALAALLPLLGASKARLLMVDAADTYPPLPKVFALWQAVQRQHGGQYEWYMKLDADSYVNPGRFRQLLAALDVQRDGPYVGLPDTANATKQALLGLQGRYCLGLGYFLHASLLQRLAPALPGCLQTAVAPHSDSELGRCAWEAARASCTAPNMVGAFKNVYVRTINGTVYGHTHKADGRMEALFPPAPPAAHFDAAVLHPIKSAADVALFHDQVTKGLRPVQPRCDECRPLKAPGTAAAADGGGLASGATDQAARDRAKAYWEIAHSCVHSPPRQIEVSGMHLPLCLDTDEGPLGTSSTESSIALPAPSGPAAEDAGRLPAAASELRGGGNGLLRRALGGNAAVAVGATVPSTAYVLSLPGQEAEFERLATDLARHGIAAERFVATDGAAMYGLGADGGSEAPGALKPGELGYLNTMRRLLQQAVDRGEPHMLVFDDDALLARDFGARLSGLLADPLCGRYMGGPQGGVLALGSTIWHNGSYPEVTPYVAGWNLVDADMANITVATGRPAQCFNAHGKTYGSFAVLYHRNVFLELLRLIATDAGARPFDHLYAPLLDKGFRVRAAFPHLAIQNVSHVSKVDPDRPQQSNLTHRAALHRWDLSDLDS